MLRRALVLLCLFALWLLLRPAIILAPTSTSVCFAEDKEETELEKTTSRSRRTSRTRRTRSPRTRSREGTAKTLRPRSAPAIGADKAISHTNFDVDMAQGGAIDAVLLVDSSRSMQRTDPDRLREQGAKLFARFLSSEDRVAIVEFSREAKEVFPLTPVTPRNLSEIDKAVESVSNEGGFTDIHAGIVAAYDLLQREGRPQGVQTVILLSDGKMDPHPSRGTAEALIDEINNTELPKWRDKSVRLYTLALSEQADKELLSQMARETGAVHWFTPDADAIHKKFSELFLTIKNPQVIPLADEGFEVDAGAKEVTFYISRKESRQEVSIINPSGYEIRHVSFPPEVKWYKGALFDIVTIRDPIPGRWGVKGIVNPEGFATLLTDVKLQVRWPPPNLRVGDSVVIMGRLTEKGRVFSAPEVEEIIYYSYKIIDTRRGEVVAGGSLVDDGTKGDQKAGDRIYSAVVKLNTEGEYRALVAVTAPTFTRQQHASFNITRGLVALEIEKPNEFTGGKERVLAILGREGMAVKNRTLQIGARLVGGEEVFAIPCFPLADLPGACEVQFGKSKAGMLEVWAMVTGVDAQNQPVKGSSETLRYHVTEDMLERALEFDDKPIIEDMETIAERERRRDRNQGIVACLLSGVWVIGLYLVSSKRAVVQTIEIAERENYVVPEEWSAEIAEFREKASSKEKREVEQADLEIFALVSDVFGKGAKKKAKALAKKSEDSANGDDEPEQEDEAELAEEDLAVEGEGADDEDGEDLEDWEASLEAQDDALEEGDSLEEDVGSEKDDVEASESEEAIEEEAAVELDDDSEVEEEEEKLDE